MLPPFHSPVTSSPKLSPSVRTHSTDHPSNISCRQPVTNSFTLVASPTKPSSVPPSHHATGAAGAGAGSRAHSTHSLGKEQQQCLAPASPFAKASTNWPVVEVGQQGPLTAAAAAAAITDPPCQTAAAGCVWEEVGASPEQSQRRDSSCKALKEGREGGSGLKTKYSGTPKQLRAKHVGQFEQHTSAESYHLSSLMHKDPRSSSSCFSGRDTASVRVSGVHVCECACMSVPLLACVRACVCVCVCLLVCMPMSGRGGVCCLLTSIYNDV